MSEITTAIPARLKNIADGGHVAGASDIYDDTLSKDQATINSEVAYKVSGATNNHLAALNANGSLKDSGKSISDLVLATTFSTAISTLEEADIVANGLAMCMALVHLSRVSTMTSVTNPEWYYVITDSANKVLCGVRKDGKAYVYASIEEIMACIIDSYNT